MTPKQIRQLRSTRQETQAEFADKLGLKTRGAVSKLESGAMVPQGPLLAALALLAEKTEREQNHRRR